MAVGAQAPNRVRPAGDRLPRDVEHAVDVEKNRCHLKAPSQLMRALCWDHMVILRRNQGA